MSDFSTVQDPAERHFRHNFFVNVMDMACFFTGYSFLSSSVILPLFVSNLSDSKLLIGLVGMIGATGYFLPQLFTASWVEKAPVKRDIVVNVGFVTERIPIFLLPLAALAAASSPVLGLVLFFLLYASHSFGAGSVAVAWQEMIAKIFPTNRRGGFMGLGMFIGTGAGLVGTMGSAWLLDHIAFPYGYVACFTLAGVFIFFSWLFIRTTREEPSKPKTITTNYWEYFLKLPGIFRDDRNFRWFIISQLILNLGGMAWVFLAIYCRNRWGLSDGMVSTYNSALLVGQAGGNLLFGFLGDRRGYWQVMLISAVTTILALALSIFSPNPVWMYLVFALRGMSLGGLFLASLMVLEFCEEANRPTYIGINSTAMGIVGILAPLAGGWLAQTTGYLEMFWISIALTLAGALLFMTFVREPRRENSPMVLVEDESVLEN